MDAVKVEELEPLRVVVYFPYTLALKLHEPCSVPKLGKPVPRDVGLRKECFRHWSKCR